MSNKLFNLHKVGTITLPTLQQERWQHREFDNWAKILQLQGAELGLWAQDAWFHSPYFN